MSWQRGNMFGVILMVTASTIGNNIRNAPVYGLIQIITSCDYHVYISWYRCTMVRLGQRKEKIYFFMVGMANRGVVTPQ